VVDACKSKVMYRVVIGKEMGTNVHARALGWHKNYKINVPLIPIASSSETQDDSAPRLAWGISIRRIPCRNPRPSKDVIDHDKEDERQQDSEQLLLPRKTPSRFYASPSIQCSLLTQLFYFQLSTDQGNFLGIVMPGIVGAGLHVPTWRIKTEDISKAWGGQSLPGEISVAGLDEDVFTLAVSAAKDALENSNIEPRDVGMVCINTTSQSKFPLAPRVAFALGLETEARVHDFGLSTRGTTQAMLASLDAVSAGSVRSALVIGVEVPIPKPGSSDELSWGAAAGAVVIGKTALVLAVKGCSSHSSAFVERWAIPGTPFQKETAFSRFGRDMGYVDHVCSSTSSLFNRLALKPEALKLAIFQESGSAERAAKTLGIAPDRILRTQSSRFFGDTGSAALLLGLIESADKVRAGDLLLLASYGIGGSDALCLVAEKPEEMGHALGKLRAFCERKIYVDYPSLLRHRKIIGYGS